MSGRQYPPPIERFMSRVQKTDTCWIWTASKGSEWGYGQFRGPGGKVMTTHRFAYSHFHGPIPEGKIVCHSCDNPSCVNPAHLFLGTVQDNINDMRAKGRQNDFGRKGPARLKRKYQKLRHKTHIQPDHWPITKCGREIGTVKMVNAGEAPTCLACRKEFKRDPVMWFAGASAVDKE